MKDFSVHCALVDDGRVQNCLALSQICDVLWNVKKRTRAGPYRHMRCMMSRPSIPAVACLIYHGSSKEGSVSLIFHPILQPLPSMLVELLVKADVLPRFNFMTWTSQA